MSGTYSWRPQNGCRLLGPVPVDRLPQQVCGWLTEKTSKLQEKQWRGRMQFTQAQSLRVFTSTLRSSALTSPRRNLSSLHRRLYSQLRTAAEEATRHQIGLILDHEQSSITWHYICWFLIVRLQVLTSIHHACMRISSSYLFSITDRHWVNFFFLKYLKENISVNPICSIWLRSKEKTKAHTEVQQIAAFGVQLESQTCAFLL